jgi:hypothetical protein
MSQTQFEILQNEITGLRSDFKGFIDMFSKALEAAINDKIEKAPCRQTKKMKELEDRIAKLEQNQKK